eukprot:TRINITY_DN2009_c0_g1_i1.p1 TRINITY_DN2009_c0_g1~~TRINITY_DN2009_c0_g1_i1.p1  ORF type:complete len:664 (+),score=239.09 TRINITY_DN2009_c0_g1_i1:110-2101(+)
MSTTSFERRMRELEAHSLELERREVERKRKEEAMVAHYESVLGTLQERLGAATEENHRLEMRIGSEYQVRLKCEERVSELEMEVEQLTLARERDRVDRQNALDEVAQLVKRLRIVDRENDEQWESVAEEFRAQERDFELRFQKFAQTAAQLRALEEELQVQQVEQEKEKLRFEKTERILLEKDSDRKKLKKRCLILERQVDLSQKAKIENGLLIEELTRCRESNQRLLRLLSTVRRYQELFNVSKNGEYAYVGSMDIGDRTSSRHPTSRGGDKLECEDDGMLMDDSIDDHHHIGEIIAPHHSTGRKNFTGTDAQFRSLVRANDRPVIPKREVDYWIPEEAFKLASAFKHEQLPHLSLDLFKSFFVSLNRIWRAREKTRIDSEKKKMSEKIQTLRRKLAQRKPYEDVVATQKIVELKKKLKKCGRNVGASEHDALLESLVRDLDIRNTELVDLKRENEKLLSRLDARLRHRDDDDDHVAEKSSPNDEAIIVVKRFAYAIDALKKAWEHRKVKFAAAIDALRIGDRHAKEDKKEADFEELSMRMRALHFKFVSSFENKIEEIARLSVDVVDSVCDEQFGLVDVYDGDDGFDSEDDDFSVDIRMKDNGIESGQPDQPAQPLSPSCGHEEHSDREEEDEEEGIAMSFSDVNSPKDFGDDDDSSSPTS